MALQSGSRLIDLGFQAPIHRRYVWTQGLDSSYDEVWFFKLGGLFSFGVGTAKIWQESGVTLVH